MINCAMAGADVVDLAVDSMSGMTSQPSMGAFVAALQGSDIDTGFDLQKISAYSAFWEQVRFIFLIISRIKWKLWSCQYISDQDTLRSLRVHEDHEVWER